MPIQASPPHVSVIIPTYNWSGVLRYAIQSVLWQSFQDFELLIIGDGCTDDSAEVVASFSDSRLHWHNLPRNSGSQSAPNNRGLELARGAYIAYLGHDDVWHPTHLGALVRAMRETGADLAYTLAVMIGPAGSGVRILTGVSPDGTYHPPVGIPPSSLMHRRELVREIGGWKDFRSLTIPPDLEIVLRAHQAGRRFTPVPELTVWKFNSAWRPGSYVQKPCHEQAECVRRIREEPDFRYREAVEIAAAYVLQRVKSPTDVPIPRPLEELPRGWLVEQWRRVRGLEPLNLEEAPPLRAPPAPGRQDREKPRTLLRWMSKRRTRPAR